MVEWSITTVLKTVVLRGTGGSNPSLSAITFVSPWVSAPKDFLFANTPPVTPLRLRDVIRAFFNKRNTFISQDISTCFLGTLVFNQTQRFRR